MRIWVFEYITGGGLLNESLPVSLAAEGDQMLRALAKDLAAIDMIRVVVTRDERLPALGGDVVEVRLGATDSFDHVWRHVLRDVDAVWPIAPETGGLLEHLCSEVLRAGKILLNSPPAGVRLAASKQATLACLASFGIPVVPTYTAQEFIADRKGQWVVKPDDGAGCEGLRLFKTLGQARQAATHHEIIQPFLQGQDMSLSLVCDWGSATLLSVNRQRIRRIGNRLKLDSCVIHVNPGDRDKFVRLAADIACAMPSLRGYVGVDLLVSQQGIKVLEVNPRLTTSYADLSRRSGFNPARRVVALFNPLSHCAPALHRPISRRDEPGGYCDV